MKAIVKPEFLWLPEGAEAQLHVLTYLLNNSRYFVEMGKK